MNMSDTAIGRIRTRLAQIQKDIRNIGPVMRGSVTLMGTRHKQPYFSVSVKGKTRVLYLGAARAEVAKRYSENYGKLVRLVDRMTLLNMELLKTQGTDARTARQTRERPSGRRGRS
jgi:hypothetical protein